MRVGLLTREWPPDVYGGAGVHVEHLAPALRRVGVDVEVHSFGGAEPVDGLAVTTHSPDPRLEGANSALQVLSTDLSMTAATAGVDLVHSHTWYANLGGHLASLLHDVPHVVTTHSLEPHRPWKAEQLGGGYRLSSWAEQTALHAADAVVAVSEGMRRDVLVSYPDLDPARVHVVHNGIDVDAYAPTTATDVLDRIGVTRPYALFVGRITRQKGLVHLLRAARDLPGGLVLCAGSPDTPEIAAETADLVAELQRTREGVVWVRETLPRPEIAQLLAHATVFACPSVYEPLGIVNLEAMACGTAVVASDVGGIPEVVEDGRTGVLVHHDPQDPAGFERGLADALGTLLADPARAEALGAAGRERAVAGFSWDALAQQTREVYASVLRPGHPEAVPARTGSSSGGAHPRL